HCESFNAWNALFGRLLLIPIKEKAFKYLPNRYVRRCVMNGKRRPQWTELSRQPCWEYSDTEIEKRASSVLRWKIRYNSIRVTVEKGHLTLLGEVNWDLDCKAAEQTVRKLSGVTGVTNL